MKYFQTWRNFQCVIGISYYMKFWKNDKIEVFFSSDFSAEESLIFPFFRKDSEKEEIISSKPFRYFYHFPFYFVFSLLSSFPSSPSLSLSLLMRLHHSFCLFLSLSLHFMCYFHAFLSKTCSQQLCLFLSFFLCVSPYSVCLFSLSLPL